MKKVILFIVFGVICLNAQWMPLNPSFFPGIVIDRETVYADSTVIMVPTGRDFVFKSFDKGKTWIIDFFRDRYSSGKIAGTTGSMKMVFSKILYKGKFTTDDGGSWDNTFFPIFLSSPIVDVESARSEEFLVAGKTNLKRKSAGSITWLNMIISFPPGEEITGLACFKGTDDYFLVTNANNFLHSYKRGIDFAVKKTFSGSVKLVTTVESRYVITFVNDPTQLLLYRSGDKGVTWDSIPVPYRFRDIRMFTVKDGIGTSEDLKVYHTSDSMKTWHQVPGLRFKEMALINGTEAIGFDENHRAWLTSDRGQTWEISSELGIAEIRGMAVMDQNEMFVVTAPGNILRSSDYGYYWQKTADTIPGTVVSTARESDGAFLAKTSSGEYFRFQQSPRAITPVNVPKGTEDHAFYAYDSVYILEKDTSVMLISTDRGENWTESVLPVSRKINFVYARGREIFVGQDSSRYLRSANFGRSWQDKRIYTSLPSNITGIVGHGDTVFIANSNAKVFFTTNGGNYWRQTGSPASKFFFFGDDQIYLFTSDYRLFMTMDLGAIFTEQSSGPENFHGLSLLASRAGAFGLMLNSNSLLIKYAMGVPVEFTTFSAETVRNGVLLNWSTATETNNHGFFIQKNSDGSWRDLAFVPGKGSTVSVNSYSFIDENRPATGEKVLYRLRQVDHSGEMSYSKEIEVTGVPVELSLQQNYPNPFNPVTVIRYALPVAGYAELRVYNSAGELVKVLVNGEIPAGEHSFEFNAADLPSGIYFYRLDFGGKRIARKMLLLK
ncbi:MAG: hypothetical protein HBSAPP04_02990 [Ignavibacteriaceae bacterium]|nr:MAG: T9SS C-terminal target domain-containing protein [Chlorobiota bacterium]GJQ31460.1 MAG: hypothetical protein HBSAPP04_02990 [Ignavibacteriaceae bacterium]